MVWGPDPSNNGGAKFRGGWGFNNTPSPKPAESSQPTEAEADLGHLAIPETFASEPTPPEDLGAREEVQRLEEEGLISGISDEDRDMMLRGKMPGERRLGADQDRQLPTPDPELEDKRMIEELDEEAAREAEEIHRESYPNPDNK